ncbi:MAG TPA: amidohydrolase family protein [Bryobacteraceae bacterium]|jgi:imidazolonepropionase|nr:amidohydrolase family protein [Bryobacteraceae bacterium]
MPPATAASAVSGPRTLIRNARQLLTLRGASGSRRGSAMSDLQIIPNGALLVHNGVIEEAGPTRRVENLAAARNAREIDASGRIVMPAFVDPDIALVVPPQITRSHGEIAEESLAIRVTSRRNVEIRAAAAGMERARYGCVTAGAHTACAADLKSTLKILRAHRTLQLKPLRIRSVLSWNGIPDDELTSKWFPSVRKNKLATVVDLPVDGDELPHAAALAASVAGFALRFRSPRQLSPEALQLALSGGAISIVAPVEAPTVFLAPLAAIGCVRVIPASGALEDDTPGIETPGFRTANIKAANIRAAIDGGAAIALSSSFRSRSVSSFNMQFLLYLAVRHFDMTAEEAITATTYNAACSLRMSHVTGSLEPGKSADLIMLDVPDYRDLPRRAGHHDLTLVMRAGGIVSRHAGPLILD